MASWVRRWLLPWAAENALWQVITGSVPGKAVVTSLVVAATGVWGFLSDLPGVYLLVLMIVAAAGTLTLLNQVTARRMLASMHLYPGLPGYSGRLPKSDYKPASREELASSFIKNRYIRIADLVGNETIVDGKTLEDCFLDGPAMILGRDGTLFRHCTFNVELPIDNLFIEIDLSIPRMLHGLVVFKGVVVRDCFLSRVGLFGTAEQIEEWKLEFRG